MLLCVLASPYLCNCKLLARHLLGVFCNSFCFQSGALSLPICCVLELKHALCCLLELKSLTRVVPQCFNGFHWFCHGLHVFNGFGWNLSGLHYFSTMFMDFWIDLMDFLMVFIFIVLFNHSLILDGVAWFKLYMMLPLSLLIAMCLLILAWLSNLFLRIHDAHNNSCKCLDVNP